VSEDQKVVVSTSYKGIRGLDEDVAKMYGIQLQLDADNNPVRYAFKYPTNVKYRGYESKKIWFKERGQKNNKLFGPAFNAGSSKRLYLTEGEFDAASLYQALGKTFPVLSVPSASFGDDFLKVNFDYLSSFEQLVWAGDNDEPGKKAGDRLYRAFPSKFYFVPLTKWKDANEALTSGGADELKWAALKPQRWSPDNFFCSDEAVRKVLREENPYEYTPTGITRFDEVMRGVVRGGLTFLKAPPGSGKTEIFRKIETGLLENNPDITIGLLHMEEMKSTTYRAMATYGLGTNVRTKDDAAENGITEEQVEEAAVGTAKGERTVVFEMRSGDDPMELLSYVHLAATVYGVDFVFIDHVQRLAYLGGIEGATNTLTKLSSNLAQLAKELNIGVILISHVNEDGHTKYAKSLEEEAIICIRIERDKESTDEQTRNTTKFYVEKNRPFSKLGYAGSLYYDPYTTILTEVFEDD
jgi:twinkle protein